MPTFRAGRPSQPIRLVLSAGSLFLALSLLLSGGCAHKTAQGPAGNTYRVCMTAEPTTFDPAMVQDGTTIDLLQQVYEGLVQWTPQNTLAPCLATSWKISPDGMTYTFKIRPNVKFQSGKTMTAQDVVYSFQRSLDPALGSPVAITYLGDIVGSQAFSAGKAKTLTGVKALDAQTVQIQITKPKAYWIDVLTYPTAYVVNSDAVSKDSGGKLTADNADGTGPFSVSQYQRGDHVDLKANPSYWDGAPSIAGQHRPIVIDANTRHNLYLSNQIDDVDESAGALQGDSNDPSLKSQVQFFPRAATWYVGLNQKAFPQFKDIRVRQAFAYATDKSQIVSEVFQGQRHVAQDLLPEGVPGWTSDFKGLPYDPAKAKQLLAAAGYPNGKGFPIVPVYYRESYPDVEKAVDLLRQMYQNNLGITVLPKKTEWATLLEMEDNNALPCFVNRWAADYLDPQDYYTVLLRTGQTENHVLYSNPKFDALCDAADVDQNPAQRAALYRQAARIAADDVPRVPLYYQRDPELVKPWVGHLEDCLMGHLPYKHLTLQASK